MMFNEKPLRNIDIVIITTVPKTLESFLVPIIVKAKELGFCVVGISSGECVDSIQRLTNYGIPIVVIPFTRSINPIKDIISLGKMIIYFKQNRIRLVHTHTPKASFIGQIASLISGIRCRISTIHGLYFPYLHGYKKNLVRLIEMTSCRLSNYIISVSNEDREFLINEKGVRNDLIETMSMGVDMVKFNPLKNFNKNRNDVRTRLGIANDSMVIGIVARMVKEKGFLDLFAAIKELNKKKIHPFLLHIGSPDFSRNDGISPEIVENYGIKKQCRFVGFRSDVEKYLCAMDVFCLPSYREGFPVSIMEAMAMGLPCLTTDVRGCREAIRNMVDGLIVPKGDVKALTEALHKLITSEEIRSMLGQSARERAIKLFDREIIAKRHMEIYTKMLSEY